MADSFTTPLIALGGVILGLASGHFQAWRQSKREVAKQKIERDQRLKSEAYIPLIAAFAEANQMIATLAAAPHDKLSEIRLSPKSQAALGAKDLIGSKEVILSVGAAARELALAFSRLMLKKSEEAKLTIDRDSIMSRIDQIIAENNEINRHIEALIAQGGITPQYFSVYNERFRRNQEKLNELFPERDQIMERRNSALKELQKECIRELISLTKFTAKAVSSIRRDLDLSDEEETIVKFYKDSSTEIGKFFPDLIDEIWKDEQKEG